MNRQNTLTGFGMLTNVGQNAVNQSIGVGQNYGNQVSNNDMNLGRSLGDVAMNGNQYVGNMGLRGAMASGDVRLGGANATSQGQAASAKAWGTTVGGVADGLTDFTKAMYGQPNPVSLDTLKNLPVNKPNPYQTAYVPPSPWGAALTVH